MAEALCTMCVCAIDAAGNGYGPSRVVIEMDHGDTVTRMDCPTLIHVLEAFDQYDPPYVRVEINGNTGFSLIGRAVLQGSTMCPGHVVQIGHVTTPVPPAPFRPWPAGRSSY